MNDRTPDIVGASHQAPSLVPRAVRRRDFVGGGLAGLIVGGTIGGLAGRAGRQGKAPEPAPPPDSPPGGLPAEPLNVSYAQCGEDIVLKWLLINLAKATTPSYLDIGAWEPVESSNTYMMYATGGRGVLVEPNPNLADKIRTYRPEDKLLTAGVGIGTATEADYFMFNDTQLNTFDREQVDRVLKESRVQLQKTVKVPLISINRVIAEHMGGKAPDVLSIDIEGLDLACLQTVDWARYRPKVVCAETLITLTKSHNLETTAFMQRQGYEVRGMTYANTLYVDKKLLA